MRPLALSIWFAAILLAPGSGAQTPPRLELPVDCEIGVACVVQNYVDQDPGPGARDHACGPLTYDGHKGTDIRLPGRPEMAAGVAVLAAAPGVVRARRDGEADASASQTGPEAGPDAGNAVVVDHGDGWESQYSHLRQGSIAVALGERVAAGERLGLIGWSGRSEFPHLEFALRHNGRAIDPFTGGPAGGGCGRGGAPLWSPAAQAALAYQAGGLLRAGFAAEAPELGRALDGDYDAPPTTQAPALVFWAVAWGLRESDRETIRLIAPDGRVLVESAGTLPRNKAQWLRYLGKKRKAAGFPPGRYRGEYRVTRATDGDSEIVVEVVRTLELR